MQLLATPGFLAEATSHGFNHIPLIPRLLRADEPSWIVGDPATKEESFDDQGRTLKVNAPFRFYMIRDKDEEGQTVITALLPEEY